MNKDAQKQQMLATQKLNADIARWDDHQNQSIQNISNLINLPLLSRYARVVMGSHVTHQSTFYKVYGDKKSKWDGYWPFVKREYHEVRIDQSLGSGATQHDYDKEAKAILVVADANGGFIKPLAYDIEMKQWVVVFRNKADAMLFKLTYAGAA